MEDLPERINAIKVISYYVPRVVEDVCNAYSIKKEEVTLKMVIEWVDDLVKEDFAYQDYTGDVILQDENGTEL
jgi:hypothetical protein